MHDQTAAGPGHVRFQLLYARADRGRCRVPVPQCANVEFESAPPVVRLRPYKGQRNHTGERWTATVARHVAFRSWLERDNLMALDFETDVVAIAAQPFTLLWQARGRERKHTPAFFARLADGGAVLADVYGAETVSARRVEARAALAEACGACGWDLRLLGGLEPVFAANLRWLSGYRHPRNNAPGYADALREAFAQPTPLFDGVRAVGDPIAVLPTAYHLLWRQELACELRAAVLGSATPVWRHGAGTR